MRLPGAPRRSPGRAAARPEPAPGRRVQQQVHVAAELGQVLGMRSRHSPFFARRAPARQHPAEPPPGGAVARQGGQLRPFRQAEPRGGQQPRRPGAGARRSRSAAWARTMPATELRSAMAKAGRPSSIARAAYSCGWLPPVRKVKFEVMAELGEGHGAAPALASRGPAAEGAESDSGVLWFPLHRRQRRTSMDSHRRSTTMPCGSTRRMATARSTRPPRRRRNARQKGDRDTAEQWRQVREAIRILRGPNVS